MQIREENDLVYIKNEKGNEIPFGWILEHGALKNESDYFIATKQRIKDKPNPYIAMKSVKWAIFDSKTGEQVSEEFDWIATVGLVKGESKYFRGTRDKKDAIFSLEGQVSEWFDKIRDRGALTGESNYFWGKRNKHYALYDIETGEKLTPDFKSSVLAGAVVGKSDLVVGSFGEEIFFLYNIQSGKIVSPEFDEDKLIEILKHGDLERALKELTEG